MPYTHLDAPLFIKEICGTHVNTVSAPFFHNEGGHPAYRSGLPLITNARMALGNEYIVADILNTRQTPPYGVEKHTGITYP